MGTIRFEGRQERGQQPLAGRPYMPGYGIKGPDEGSGLLPWSWARQQLADSHDYWLATVRPDGRPHVMPVWGVWAEEAFWFSSAPRSRKVLNLTANPRCVVTTDSPRDPVVLEGVAERVADSEAVAAFADWINAKYAERIAVEFFTANATVRVRPLWAFALRGGDFTGSPTRWVFPRSP